MKYIFLTLISVFACEINAQPVVPRVLFIGNSYTAVNNLPQMTYDLAKSAGDSMYFDSSTPGGYTFQLHSTNATSLSKIAQGNWDYVVLQEQSQIPSFTDAEVVSMCFPYARMLDSLINAQSPCAETVFYMTWGRKNGDATNCAVWPPVCTYLGMDSLLNLRYRMMADSNQAVVSPVGAVWRYIRANYPAIELYQADESHPSVAGSYAAACSFYTALFRKDPALITNDGALSASDALTIRNVVHTVVFDSLSVWHIGEYDPVADINYYVNPDNEVDFSNLSSYADSYLWQYGDGDTSSLENPSHIYTSPGIYTVSLVASHCTYSDTAEMTVNIYPVGISAPKEGSRLTVYPNPAQNSVSIEIIKNGDFPVQVEIYNCMGSCVFKGICDNVKHIGNIDISELPKGIYFLSIKNKSYSVTKFVKE